MNGKSPMISTAPPFVLRLSKDERGVFQQNLLLMPKISFIGWTQNLIGLGEGCVNGV